MPSLTQQTFQLTSDFIPLNVLLKLLSVAPSGGTAKGLICAGEVKVDGLVETRIRRKLRAGSSVQVLGQQILVAEATKDGT